MDGLYLKIYTCSRSVLFISALGACLFLSVSAIGKDRSGDDGNNVPARESKYISRWAVSTNVADWAYFLTPNVDVQYSVAKNVSLEAGAKVNFWTFNDNDPKKRNRQARQEYALGIRVWPWHVYSGWWIGAKAQYLEYSRRQFDNKYRKEEGQAYGVDVSGGYSLQITPWLNFDFGLGLWLGGKSYKVYEDTVYCPECGKRVDGSAFSDNPSRGFFILPNELVLSLMFIF